MRIYFSCSGAFDCDSYAVCDDYDERWCAVWSSVCRRCGLDVAAGPQAAYHSADGRSTTQTACLGRPVSSGGYNVVGDVSVTIYH